MKTITASVVSLESESVSGWSDLSNLVGPVDEAWAVAEATSDTLCMRFDVSGHSFEDVVSAQLRALHYAEDSSPFQIAEIAIAVGTNTPVDVADKFGMGFGQPTPSYWTTTHRDVLEFWEIVDGRDPDVWRSALVRVYLQVLGVPGPKRLFLNNMYLDLLVQDGASSSGIQPHKYHQIRRRAQ